MKILKLALIGIVAIMIIGWIWKGMKILLWISIIVGVAYFAIQAFGSKSNK